MLTGTSCLEIETLEDSILELGGSGAIVRCFGSLAQDKTTLHTLRLELPVSVFVLALFLLLGRVDGPSLC